MSHAAVRQYDEIELRVEGGPDGYTVQASASGAEARAPFALPSLDRDRIEDLVLRAITPRRRRIESGALGEVTALGTSLFESLVRDEVRDLYRGAAARADAAGRGLRIRLSLTGARELRALPWEMLYDEASFLVLDQSTPVVRSLELPHPHQVPEIEPPLRVLGIVSSPKGVPELDVRQERANVEKGLDELVKARAVKLEWLECATLPALLDALRADTFHILHFIGHGAFEETAGDGVLLMEDEEGFEHRVSSRRLGQILRGHDSLQLAVINACEGGRGALDDPFAGIAASLLRQGVPAVVAMQFEITDRAAIVFSRGFYDALARGFPVDTAVAEARRAIWADDNDVEWATPVLFLRARDGEIFRVRTTEPPKIVWTRITRLARRRLTAAVLAGLVASVVIAWLLVNGGRAGWQRLPDMPVALEAAAVAPFDGRLWIAGGVGAEEGRPKLSRVDIYDPGTRVWRPGPAVPVATDHASLVSTGRQLFLIGGLASTGSVRTVYRLDAATGAWQIDVPLPEPRGAGAAVWDGGRIVFAGGVGSDGRAQDDVWALQDGRWRPIGKLQRAREKLAAATDGYGTAWFLAGRDPNDQAGAFPYVDVVQASSVKPAGEMSPRQGPAGVWWPGSGACMIGGQSTDGFSGSLECLSEPPRAPALDPGRAGLGAAVVGRTLYVVGGYGTGSHGSRSLESLPLPES